MKSKNLRKIISIIVVSFNTKKKFLKTIKSIRNQTYKNYEIIIVDGYSTDGTVEEIKKLKKNKIKSIIQKDKGIYDAMNKGIFQCSGKWVLFLNSGDVFASKRTLQKLLNKKLNNHDVIFGDTIVTGNYFNYKIKSKNFTNNTIVMPFCHQSAIVKLKYLRVHKFNLNYKFFFDFNFFFNLFNKKLKFYKYDGTISKVEALGTSDLNRQKVFSENITIFLLKSLHLKVLRLMCLKFFEYLKSLIKFFLPHKFIRILLIFKYKKKF